ncbi:MAG: hypothetical protein ABII89_07495 [Candidatus Omnitrophota bacterium]
MKRLWKCGGIAVLIVVLGLTYAYLTYADEIPTTDFIKASLQMQEERSSPGLSAAWEVRVLRDGKEIPSFLVKKQYIRTPSVFYLKTRIFKNNEELFVREFRYERNTDTFKILETQVSTGNKTGVIGSGIPSEFLHRSFVDPLYIATIWDNQLISLFKTSGKIKVLGDTKSIDGYICLAVQQIGEPCKIWLDSNISFCPRLIEINQGNEREESISIKEYKEIIRDVWFPMFVKTEAKEKDSTLTNLITVTSVSAGKVIPEENLAINFPPGTTIRDKDTDLIFEFPQ